MTMICGIDFGTSNSTVAVVRDANPELVPVEGTHTTIPSAIFFPADGSPPAYGRAGMAAYATQEPGRLMRSLKSILGSDLMVEKTGVGGRYVTFEDILVGFVSHLRAKAEAFAGAPVTRVVMGRPVHFVDDNPQVDARAQAKLADIAHAAGFEEVTFQFEPIAAALSFEHTLKQDERVFISDIGGGTADFSIVKVGPSHVARPDRSADILANEGIRVGGTNLDMRLSMAAVMPQLGSRSKTLAGRDLPRWPFVDLATWHRIHTIATQPNLMTLRQILRDCAEPETFSRYMRVISDQRGHAIATSVEQAKIALSASDDVVIDLSAVEQGLVARADSALFKAAVATELGRIAASIGETVAASGGAANDITTVFLTGGTSAVPAVKALLTEAFPQARIIEGDLFNSVGFGLALEAKRRFSPAPPASKRVATR